MCAGQVPPAKCALFCHAYTAACACPLHLHALLVAHAPAFLHCTESHTHRIHLTAATTTTTTGAAQLTLRPTVSSAAAARSLKHGNDANVLIGKLKDKVQERVHSFSEKLHKGHHTYATQTVLAAQPTVVIAPMPQLAPQPQTVIAPTSQQPPAPAEPTTLKTKSLTVAGHHKSITITKATEVPVSGCWCRTGGGGWFWELGSQV